MWRQTFLRGGDLQSLKLEEAGTKDSSVLIGRVSTSEEGSDLESFEVREDSDGEFFVDLVSSDSEQLSAEEQSISEDGAEEKSTPESSIKTATIKRNIKIKAKSKPKAKRKREKLTTQYG